MVAEPGTNVQSMRQPRDPAAGFDLPRIERAVREILEAIGEDPDREGLRGTPGRVARAYVESFGGLHQNAGEIVSIVFDDTDQAGLLNTHATLQALRQGAETRSTHPMAAIRASTYGRWYDVFCLNPVPFWAGLPRSR